MGHLCQTYTPAGQVPSAVLSFHHAVLVHLRCCTRNLGEDTTKTSWEIWYEAATLIAKRLAVLIIVGPIVRIAPNEVAIADPEAIKTIYAAHTGFTKVRK